MFENMAGPVGFAMHEDRLARAAKEMRLAEAEQGRRLTAGGGHRKVMAKAMSALATRLAPSVALPGRYTQATGRW
ncbi:MAG: hypothetical protein LC793_12755 [Thermomicrobia bacterium]|nr:hypothetical protein [Thermomicrobia bacterium]MCA1723042.1 hypothetical protein [Thermomicrobia bacterium]